MKFPSLAIAVCLGLMVWAFCRAYYFAFYAIEKYVDSGYKFSGLIGFFTYLIQKRKRESNRKSDGAV
jgi:hypothetical protein